MGQWSAEIEWRMHVRTTHLELAAHESLLAVELAVSHVHEHVVRGVDGNISLALCLALVSLTLLY